MLPTSCISSDVIHIGELVSSSAFSDVYRCTLQGRLVALKAFRLHQDDIAKTIEVTAASQTPSHPEKY